MIIQTKKSGGHMNLGARIPLAAIVAGSIMITSCRTTTETDDSSLVKTDLGPVGNTKVVDQFLAYKSKPVHCNDTGTGTRVMLTGFGLFSSPPHNNSGTPYNISGLVTQFMATDAVFPSPVDTSKSSVRKDIEKFEFAKYSHMPSGAEGAVVTQRELTIDNKPVTVCFVLLDVIWDQAAAIILYETTQFKPDRIIMSGLNAGETSAGMFEAGAVNHATSYEGFSSDGKSNLDNVPVGVGGSPVLPTTDPGVEKTITMTWNGKDLATQTEPVAKQIKKKQKTGLFRTKGEDAARPSNDYICNNVSFVILHAIKGAVVNLAGGKLRFGPASAAPAANESVEFIEFKNEVATKVKSAGFFHYPDTGTDAGETIFGWGLVMAKAMTVGI